MSRSITSATSGDEWSIDVPKGKIVHTPTGLHLEAVPMGTAEDYRRIEVLQQGQYRVIGQFRIDPEAPDVRQRATAPGDANPFGVTVWTVLADLDDYGRVGDVFATKSDPITGKAQLEALCRTGGRAWISHVQAERAREDGGPAE